MALATCKDNMVIMKLTVNRIKCAVSFKNTDVHTSTSLSDRAYHDVLTEVQSTRILALASSISPDFESIQDHSCFLYLSRVRDELNVAP